MGPHRMFGMTPWVRRLMVANLVVFLFQVTLFVSPAFLTTLQFAPLTAFRHPWTFVTYMFVHANLLHLAFNLLALYADLGHFGHRAIQIAWFGAAFPCLLLNYFGQGALLLP